jgi:hypothetical protein
MESGLHYWQGTRPRGTYSGPCRSFASVEPGGPLPPRTEPQRLSQACPLQPWRSARWAGAFGPGDFTATGQLKAQPCASGRVRYGSVRIEDELYGRPLVEIGISFGCLVERDHLRIDDVRDWDAIVQDRLQELTIIAKDRRLTRVEGMRFRPAETEIER